MKDQGKDRAPLRNFRLDDDEWEAWGKFAKEHGMSRSDLIRQSVINTMKSPGGVSVANGNIARQDDVRQVFETVLEFYRVTKAMLEQIIENQVKEYREPQKSLDIEFFKNYLLEQRPVSQDQGINSLLELLPGYDVEQVKTMFHAACLELGITVKSAAYGILVYPDDEQ